MVKKTQPHHSEKLPSELIRELEEVARLARDASKASVLKGAGTGVDAPGSSLAVMRVLSGISQAEWESFSSTHGLASWLAVRLDEEPAKAVQSLLAMQKNIARQRDTDALTDISNRGFFDRKLKSEIERALRLHSELSLVILDVDDFKQINDTYGHACGDEVLRRLARTLEKSVRAYDTVARIGGEEFAIILPGAHGWRAVGMAKRILDIFQQETFHCEECDTHFQVTFSAGVSTLSQLPKADNPHQELMRASDKALYEAKKLGKNHVGTYTGEHWVDPRESLVQSHEKEFLFGGAGTDK